MSSHIQFKIEDKFFNCPAIAKENDFEVKSLSHTYKVSFDESVNPVEKINHMMAQNSKNILCIDKQVFALYRDQITIAPERIFIAEATENFKTLDGVAQLLDFFHQRQLSKSATVVVVGGGIVQDVSGFAAAIYKRGLRWVFFPTTLLAMCDSCIGAKTGVNFHQAKNQIGLFAAPAEVIIYSRFIDSLSAEALASGLGEILKLCITGGHELLQLYQNSVRAGKVITPASYKTLILSGLYVKKAVIEEDEFDTHYRKGLNYGHTLGHVIESLSDYRIPHGIAVAMGMKLVNELACKKGYLTLTDKDYLNQFCEELIDDRYVHALKKVSIDTFFDLLKNDKKIEGDILKLVVPKKPGELAFISINLDNNVLKELSLLLTNLQGVAA